MKEIRRFQSRLHPFHPILQTAVKHRGADKNEFLYGDLEIGTGLL